VKVKIFHRTYENHLNLLGHHPEKATSACYNNNYLEKIYIIIGDLHGKNPVKVANDLGELPSDSHSMSQGHH